MRSVVKQPRYSDLKIPGVGHAHFSDLAFRIRSAISVRSTGLSRLDRNMTMASEIRHVWTPGVGGCSNKPRVTVVLQSSTPCTLAYLTELWPIFKNFRPPLVLTLATMLFRLFLVGYIEKSGYER
jgi:hypothetical protein